MSRNDSAFAVIKVPLIVGYRSCRVDASEIAKGHQFRRGLRLTVVLTCVTVETLNLDFTEGLEPLVFPINQCFEGRDSRRISRKFLLNSGAESATNEFLSCN